MGFEVLIDNLAQIRLIRKFRLMKEGRIRGSLSNWIQFSNALKTETVGNSFVSAWMMVATRFPLESLLAGVHFALYKPAGFLNTGPRLKLC